MSDRSKTALTALASAMLVAGCDATASGTQAYRAGRFAEALAAFRDAEKRAGDDASAELVYDRALAALRAGEPAEAETAADAAATRGGPEFAALRDFLRGNAAYSRAEAAEFQADMPGNALAAFDRAIGHAENAREAWKVAAAERDDWAPARRNVQRAEILVGHLKARRAEAQKQRGGPPGPRPRTEPRPGKEPDPGAPPPPPPPPRQPEPQARTGDPPKAPPPESRTPDLTRAEVLRLIETLALKEREKLELRRARRGTQPPDVERDW